MPNKSHKNSVEFHKSQLEEKQGYRCKSEFDLIRNGALHRLDLACAKKDKPSVAMEIESNKNFDNPQIQSNAADLEAFKKVYPGALTYHIHTSQEIDFDKEFSKPELKKPAQKTRTIVRRYGQ